MDKTKRIGITGGIGAGKTMVCRILNAMGYPVFYSDNEAKSILNTDADVRQAVIAIFGKKIYTESGLDRAQLAKIVFNEPSLLTQLNTIVHPAVRRAFEKWVSEQTTPLIFNEAAILFETGIYKQYDFNIMITAPLETRIDRVMKRDNVSRDEVMNRINKQWPDAEKEKLADTVLYNDNEHLLIPQVLNLLDKLLV